MFLGYSNEFPIAAHMITSLVVNYAQTGCTCILQISFLSTLEDLKEFFKAFFVNRMIGSTVGDSSASTEHFLSEDL